MMKISLYIHIPFCSAKCRYCDFFSIPFNAKTDPAVWRKLQEEFLDTILIELEGRLEELTIDKIDTIFIGGGTPSSLNPELLDSFLSKLRTLISGMIDFQTEFSIEANPESSTSDFLEIIGSHNLSRLSLGVQSFDTSTLEKIGRASFPERIMDKVTEIRSSWDRKLSLDIITGVTSSYIDDIKKAVKVSPEHLSVYALTIEEDTPLHEDLINQRIVAPDDELQAESMAAAKSCLEENGFHRYEVSNYAKADSSGLNECRHNLMYWNMQSYIGLGPAAVSSIYMEDKRYRVTNTSDIDRYIGCFSRGGVGPEGCRSTEELSGFDFMVEHYLMGARLVRGVDSEIFKARFGNTPEHFIPDTMERWRSSGLTGDGCCSLNDDGMLLLNRFLSDVWDELKNTTFF